MYKITKILSAIWIQWHQAAKIMATIKGKLASFPTSVSFKANYTDKFLTLEINFILQMYALQYKYKILIFSAIPFKVWLLYTIYM